MGRWPLADADAEALLTGRPSDREELASLERFLRDLRAPGARPCPQPSEELSRLFAVGRAVGPVGVVDAPSPEPLPVAAGRRKPVRRMAKVAAVTTTAALAVSLAAAAQVLPRSQPKAPVGVSGPATPIQLDADSAPASPVQARTGAGAAVQQPSTTVAGHPSTTTRPSSGADVDTLSPEALARLPFDVLRTLPGDVLVRLPAEVLRTLPGEALARLPLDVMKTLPGDALVRLPADVVKTLPGEALARLPFDLLRGLPPDVQNRLPADVLRLLGPPPPTTTTAPAGAPGT